MSERYLELLLAGDVDGIAGLFGGEPLIEDPREGRVAGRAGVEALVASTESWLAGRDPSVQHLRTTRGERRTVSEHVLHAGAIELPVGVVAVPGDGGVAELHVYHTMWPFNGGHTVRPHFVEPDPGAELRDVIAQFAKCLGSGDVDGAQRLFEADLYMREASGPPYVHWGSRDVRGYFEGLFAGGALGIQKNTVTDDGRCACMEFTVVGWGGERWPAERHQAGLSVYERGDAGRLRAIRIYDDVAF